MRTCACMRTCASLLLECMEVSVYSIVLDGITLPLKYYLYQREIEWSLGVNTRTDDTVLHIELLL